jgi:hypothetical protein
MIYHLAIYCTNLIIVYEPITNNTPINDHLIQFFPFAAAASSFAIIYCHPENINHTATTVPIKNVADKIISSANVSTLTSG